MPYIGVSVGQSCLPDKCFGCVHLIGTHNHQNLVRVIQDRELCQHLNEQITSKKHNGKILEIRHPNVVIVRPKECMGIHYVFVAVGKVFGVHTIGNHKKLNKMVKPLIRVLSVSHNLIDSFFDVHATAFQLDLNKRQAVDKQRNIVTVGVFADNSCLMCHLIAVLCVILIKKLEVRLCPIVHFKYKLITQDFCTFKNALTVYVIQYTLPFFG